MNFISKTKRKILVFSILVSLLFTGCDSLTEQLSSLSGTTGTTGTTTETVSLSDIPAYSGFPSIEINDNIPFFSDEDKKRTDDFEEYSDLDSLGRCGVAYANICKEIQPTDERGQIGSVKPSGWQTVKYNGYIEGNYLYNRCHLIGYQLAGENANKQNLITGTRYMNCDGQLPYENEVDDYVDSTGNHVLYRVTPIFDGDNLVASGVLTEAYSVEDEGAGVQFCVYSYNVQPGIGIDYATGESWLIEGYTGEYATTTYYSTKKIKNYAEGSSETSEKESSGSTSGQETNTANTETKSESTNETASSEDGYVLNTGTKKFHKADCRYAESTSEANRKETTETKEQLVSEGYEACKVCNP